MVWAVWMVPVIVVIRKISFLVDWLIAPDAMLIDIYSCKR